MPVRLITAQDGGILCDPIILRLVEDRFWLSTDVDLEHKGVAVNSGLSVNVSDANVAVLQVQGPKSGTFWLTCSARPLPS